MNPRLSPDNNSYIITPERHYPRLSTIMEAQGNKGLDAWKKRVGEEVAKAIAGETSEWGSKVHLVTAYSDLRKWKKMEEMVKEDDSLLPPLLAWQNYVKDYIVSFTAVERVVWSDRLRVAGTIDRIGTIRGDKALSILDLKTGALYDEIGTKLAGYQIMWNERTPKKFVHRRIAIQLPRSDPGNIKVKEYTKKMYVTRFEQACEDYYALTT